MEQQFSLQHGSGGCIGKMKDCFGIISNSYSYREVPQAARNIEPRNMPFKYYLDSYTEQIAKNRQIPEEEVQRQVDDYNTDVVIGLNSGNGFFGLPDDVWEKILRAVANQNTPATPGILEPLLLTCSAINNIYKNTYKERVYHGKVKISKFITQKLIDFFSAIGTINLFKTIFGIMDTRFIHVAFTFTAR